MKFSTSKDKKRSARKNLFPEAQIRDIDFGRWVVEKDMIEWLNNQLDIITASEGVARINQIVQALEVENADRVSGKL